MIKCHHHLHRLSTAPPPSLQRKALELASFAKPAFRNAFFDETAKRLADDWLEATHRALLDHYEDTLLTSRSALLSSTMPREVFERSLQVCTRWARRQLGAKLDPSILDAALSDIRDAQMVSECSQVPTDTTAPARQATVGVIKRSTYTQTEDQRAGPSQEVWFSQQVKAQHETQRCSETPCPAAANLETTTEDTEPIVNVGTIEETQPTALTNPDVTPVDIDASPTTTNQRRSRKRSLEELSQMDLFGSIASQGPPRQRSRSLPRLPTKLRQLSSTKEAIIIGDDNLASFGNEKTDVFASDSGRLNFYRTLLRSTKETFPEVRRFVLVISHLDRRNAHTTNLTAVRNIFSAAKSLFPEAQCAVACDGICDCEPQDVRNSISALNASLQATPPNRATVIPPPEDFSCNQGRWSEATKNAYLTSIGAFLG